MAKKNTYDMFHAQKFARRQADQAAGRGSDNKYVFRKEATAIRLGAKPKPSHLLASVRRFF